MKVMLIIIISLFIFIPLSLFMQSTLERQSNEMANLIQDIDIAIKEDNWKMASDMMQNLQKKWNPKRYFWKMTTDHMEIDSIDQSFARLGALINIQAKEDCIAELAALKQALLHIPEREKLSITNIL